MNLLHLPYKAYGVFLGSCSVSSHGGVEKLNTVLQSYSPVRLLTDIDYNVEMIGRAELMSILKSHSVPIVESSSCEELVLCFVRHLLNGECFKNAKKYGLHCKTYDLDFETTSTKPTICSTLYLIFTKYG